MSDVTPMSITAFIGYLVLHPVTVFMIMMWCAMIYYIIFYWIPETISWIGTDVIPWIVGIL